MLVHLRDENTLTMFPDVEKCEGEQTSQQARTEKPSRRDSPKNQVARVGIVTISIGARCFEKH